MKWSLQQLSGLKREPLTFDKTIQLSNLQEQNDEIRNVSPIQVNGKVDHSGSLYTFTLNIKGELTLPCSRTLADVKLPIHLHVTERYHPANEYMSERFAEENDIHLFEGDMIDLEPAIKERILLEIPIQIFADGNVEGEAPESGEGWEMITEEDKANRIDPRLADLKKFFEKE